VSAVQLTRNPDGLAGALLALAQTGGDVPGGRWAELLYVVGGSLSRATGRGFVSTRARHRLPPPSTPSTRRGEAPILLLGAQPPLRGRLARLRALGASIEPVVTGGADGGHARAAANRPTDVSSSGWLSWLVAAPLIGGLVLGVGVLIFYGASFVLYLFAVGFFGALFVIAGLYVAVMELVLRLLSL